MTAPPLAVRLLLDAQDEFVATLDRVPDPGRGGPWGRLNAAGWIAAHLAASYDQWINVLAAGGEPRAWGRDWSARQTAATLARPLATPFVEARAAFVDVADGATRFLEGCDEASLATRVDTRYGPEARGYLVARAVAHLFVHMGELSVIASLAGADEVRLPGRLARCATPTDDATPIERATAPSPEVPLVARLLLDSYDEVARVAPVLSAPARFGAFDRLNPGAFTLAHIAEHEDRVWNVHAQGHPRDAWLEAAHVSTGDPRGVPDFDAAAAAFARTRAATTPYLQGLRGADLARPLATTNIGAELSRSAAHCFAHAGELMAIASLFGAEDLGQPGLLAHVGAAWGATASTDPVPR